MLSSAAVTHVQTKRQLWISARSSFALPSLIQEITVAHVTTEASTTIYKDEYELYTSYELLWSNNDRHLHNAWLVKLADHMLHIGFVVQSRVCISYLNIFSPTMLHSPTAHTLFEACSRRVCLLGRLSLWYLEHLLVLAWLQHIAGHPSSRLSGPAKQTILTTHKESMWGARQTTSS